MNKTLLRTTIFAVASLSFAMVAQAQMQDDNMGGQGAMGGQSRMGGQGGMEGQGGMSKGNMGRSSSHNGSMHKRSMKMHKSGHMNHGMSNSGNM